MKMNTKWHEFEHNIRNELLLTAFYAWSKYLALLVIIEKIKFCKMKDDIP